MENKKEEKQRLRRGLWKPEEDLILKNYVETHGEGNWSVVSKKSGLMRGGKSCRLRWKNYLRPNIKRGDISEEEEDLIIRMHKLIGNRWSLIAGRLPGRTDNEVKNYWNTHLNKKLRCQGKRKIDSSDDARNEIIDMNKKKHLRHQPSDNEPICTIEATRGRKEEIEVESNSSITNALTEEKESFNSETEVGEMVPPMNEDVALFDFGEDPFIACMDPFLLFDASECRAEDDPETYTGMGLESVFMPFW